MREINHTNGAEIEADSFHQSEASDFEINQNEAWLEDTDDDEESSSIPLIKGVFTPGIVVFAMILGGSLLWLAAQY